jgi:hypothetical protein
MATRVINVFCFPNFPAGITVPFAAAIKRIPLTTNSRAIMITTIHAGTRPSCTKAIKMAETNTLSAVRSRKTPSSDTMWYRRARYPSKKSVMDARKKTTAAVRKAQGWLTMTKTKTTTVATMRLKLSRLGALYITMILLN